MHLRDFPGDGALALGAEEFGELLERLHQAIGRLIEYHRTWLLGELAQQSLPSFLHGKETLETETVTRKPGRNYGRNACSCPRKSLDLNAFLGASADEEKPGVADAGSAGVADQGYVESVHDPVLDGADRLVLIELVVRLERTVDVIVLQQDGAGPGVFRQNQVCVLQNLDGPVCHVVEISYRCRNYVQFSVTLHDTNLRKCSRKTYEKAEALR